MEPPVGTIAMLFTDIEGSTALASRLRERWPAVLQSHHAILTEAIEAEGGYIDGIDGDAFFATFADAGGGLRAAVSAQRALRAHPWPDEVGELGVRMGLHAGHVDRGPTGYIGLEVHRAARVGAAAHGGQLLLTPAARELAGDQIPLEFLGAHRLKDFPSPVQLYCAVIDGRGASAFPPPRAYDVRPTNLPAGVPSLVGRDEDLRRVREALIEDGERVVTLTGRGGAGKTSLALVVGSELLDAHPGGVWWVPLSESGALMDSIAAATGADREVDGSAAEAIIGRLRTAGPVLIILDNMEHLLAAAPELRSVLDALPGLRLLLTSQVPTRLVEERIVPLDALDDESALTLIERVARRRGTQVRGRPEALLDVVRLLDGLPLALELAAARLPVLSPEALRDRLSASLDLLKDSGTARPERQRSLQATLDWTLDLLDEAPRALFTRLGVFAGPVELEEIELVCGADVLDPLSTLLDVALVRRVESGDGRVRFGLPEALQQIAARRLDQSPDAGRWRLAHAERQLVLAAGIMLGTMEEFEAGLAADAEITSALAWARVHDPALADRITPPWAAALANSGRLREATSVLEPLVRSPPEDPDTRADALLAQGFLHAVKREYARAFAAVDQAEQLARAPRLLYVVHLARGMMLPFTGEAAAGVRECREAVRLAHGLGAAVLADALVMETQALVASGALDEAERTLEEARRVGESVNASALRYIDTQFADLAVARGRPADALEPYARSLESAEAREDGLQVYFDLVGMASALAGLDRDEDALEVHALARAQVEDLGGRDAEMLEHVLGAASIQRAAERLEPDAVAAAQARGRAVLPGQRVARACSLAGLTILA